MNVLEKLRLKRDRQIFQMFAVFFLSLDEMKYQKAVFSWLSQHIQTETALHYPAK